MKLAGRLALEVALFRFVLESVKRKSTALTLPVNPALPPPAAARLCRTTPGVGHGSAPLQGALPVALSSAVDLPADRSSGARPPCADRRRAGPNRRRPIYDRAFGGREPLGWAGCGGGVGVWSEGRLLVVPGGRHSIAASMGTGGHWRAAGHRRGTAEVRSRRVWYLVKPGGGRRDRPDHPTPTSDVDLPGGLA